MAVLKLLANFEILHWSMQYFCMGGLYMDLGSSGIFGGIFRAKEMGFPFVGGEKGLTGSIFRLRVGRGNPNIEIYPGVVGEFLDCWGNF